MKFMPAFLPSRFYYGDRLTASARRLFARLGTGLIAMILAGAAFGLLDGSNWPDVLSGALFAWATSVIAWAVTSYRTAADDIRSDLRRTAELDLLHARLNHVAKELGLPIVDLQSEIESILVAREERLAHFAGLDEFRGEGRQEGAYWWDPDALGVRRDEE